jgi:hypothetical protein
VEGKAEAYQRLEQDAELVVRLLEALEERLRLTGDHDIARQAGAVQLAARGVRQSIQRRRARYEVRSDGSDFDDATWPREQGPRSS